MACLLLVGISLLCFALCISCNRAKSEIPFGEKEIPDMELRNADYTLAKDVAGASAENPMVMHASLITVYKSDKDTLMMDVSFRQGEKLSGSCKSASVSSDNSRATLSGDVVVYMDNDGTRVTIRSEQVEWNGNENTILCTGEVYVTYGDGTKIHAQGFAASIDENTYEFGTIMEGHLE